MSNDSGSKKIFIVYASHEVGLAEALKKILESWGFKAFYCREEDRKTRAGEGYKKLLREELKPADLAILLLSRDFQWSNYCQAEAGAIATFEKNQLVITIPPAHEQEIYFICPVLDTFDRLEATDPRIRPRLFVSTFKADVHRCLNLSQERLRADNTEPDAINKVEAELVKIIESYALKPQHRETLSLWPSIDQEESLACRSIIEHIKSSLGNHGKYTNLALVGVSLKFSLRLIKIALEEFAGIAEPGKEPIQAMKVLNPDKTLKIQLVHMDEHAHILHALPDPYDIKSIQDRDWSSTFNDWEIACRKSSIRLEPLTISRIDYIPPRIGILIDDSVLFAGRCSFLRKEAGFSLLVGEREYGFYTRDSGRSAESARGRGMIDEFKNFLAVYREEKLNGVEFEPDANEWIKRLSTSMESHHDIDEIILISQSATKFDGLIKCALRRKTKVKVYIQNSGKLPVEDQDRIKCLPARLQRMVKNIEPSKCGIAEVYTYNHLPTFRAALIGQKTLGIQIYVPSCDDSRSLEAGALRLIATQYSNQFKLLKEGLIDSFLRSSDVEREPSLRIGASGSALTSVGGSR